MNTALFVISTGRCGTQWLADVLRSSAGDEAVVAHEPLGADYAPRAMLGAKSPRNLEPEAGDTLLEHVACIERTLETKPYIECGHPLWSSLPYLLGQFARRARVIHLTRHPVPAAWSWLTQRAYCPPLAPHLPERVLLSPFDDGSFFVSFREKWTTLTAYEKSLYYWAEVNAFAIRLRETADVPWMQLRIEDLFAGQRIDELLDFAGLQAVAPQMKPVDKFHFLADPCDPRLIERHPEVMEVARACGYDPIDYDEHALRNRYLRPLAG
ncbi:MAG: hypothetical protein WB973_08990 [Thermoanaerobaculia bacterium]